MSIISKEIDVRLNGYVVDYYEKLGYEIPRIRKNNKWVVQQDATITVKVSDLPESSNLNVDVQCDCTECNKIKSISLSNYKKNIERNGMYLCTRDTKHRDFLNGYTLENIIDSLKGFYNKNNRFPKYYEYTEENGFSFTYSKTSARLLSSKSTSKSGADTRSGFKKRSKNKSYFKGSTLVMPKQ